MRRSYYNSQLIADFYVIFIAIHTTFRQVKYPCKPGGFEFSPKSQFQYLLKKAKKAKTVEWEQSIPVIQIKGKFGIPKILPGTIKAHKDCQRVQWLKHCEYGNQNEYSSWQFVENHNSWYVYSFQ